MIRYSPSDAYAIETQVQSVELPYELHIEAGAGHGFSIFDATTTPGQTVFDDWVDFFFVHVVLSAKPYEVPLFPNHWAAPILMTLIIAFGIYILRTTRKRSSD